MAYRLIFGFVALLLSLPVQADITGKPRVIDGDTIEIAGERIRLHGIDAPESKQTCIDKDGKEWRCGQEATLALSTIIGEHTITCRGDERGKYGRLIAVCNVGLLKINAMMVARGWALAYRRYSDEYVLEEDDARLHKRGLWRGEFVPPWEWRRGKR